MPKSNRPKMKGTGKVHAPPRDYHKGSTEKQNHVQFKLGVWKSGKLQYHLTGSATHCLSAKLEILQNYKLFGTKDCASGLKMRLHISFVS